jgi:hypothetical protein
MEGPAVAPPGADVAGIGWCPDAPEDHRPLVTSPPSGVLFASMTGGCGRRRVDWVERLEKATDGRKNRRGVDQMQRDPAPGGISQRFGV